MTTLLEEFLSEARDFLQGIGEKLMQLEDRPADGETLNALFRAVHTLKGNSGLFEFPEMTRVLHASEDLMDAVRHGDTAFSNELADRLLESMDFVSMLCDEAEKAGGEASARHSPEASRLATLVRALIVRSDGPSAARPPAAAAASAPVAEVGPELLVLVPEGVRMDAYRQAMAGAALHWVEHVPEEGCFFRGADPLLLARQTPGLVWRNVVARAPWPDLASMDAYQCVLDYRMLSTAPPDALAEHYAFATDVTRITAVSPLALALPEGRHERCDLDDDFVALASKLLAADDLEELRRAVGARLAVLGPDLWSASALRWLLLLVELAPTDKQTLRKLVDSLRGLDPPRRAASADGAKELSATEVDAVSAIIDTQRRILALPPAPGSQVGRLEAVAATLAGCLRASGDLASLPGLEAATAQAVAAGVSDPLRAWLDDRARPAAGDIPAQRPAGETSTGEAPAGEAPAARPAAVARRGDDVAAIPRSLKVDQAKIDRLMNLIGEMVVSKNALPYLAGRAEAVFGVRELSREIKAQHAIMNRIAEEMQDAIMQVRMMPVSVVFQRFPRLVRDTSRKLGKDVQLVLEGEDTEADKNIIEALADPLVHIIRNSLDHGFEMPDVRRAAGKPQTGTLAIRARQEAGRALIEITDDGKGIDPAVVKLKAYEKGIIDEDTLATLGDQSALNLVFASGFSTRDVVSELSGRGVGMDVVRTGVEKVDGTITLESVKGSGTTIRLSLPLSMAVTNAMIVAADGQRFGIPMDAVIETVRVPRSEVHVIKHGSAMVLRGRIVPLKSIHTLLGSSASPRTNANDELAVLVVRLGGEAVGLLVDDFCETADIVLKPMAGVLANLTAYAGSALMGDGSVLMVLNVKELF